MPARCAPSKSRSNSWPTTRSARFGRIIGELNGPPAWPRPRLTSWRMRFEMDSHADLECTRHQLQEREFTMLERHFTHTDPKGSLALG